MPVLVNTQTGLAEEVSPKAAEQGVKSGLYHVPLTDPEGKPVFAPFEEATKLVQEGYSQPTPEQLQSLLRQGKYGTTEQTVKAAAEAAASAATLSGSRELEKALGLTTPAEMRGREEQLGTAAKFGSELGGLALSELIPGVGAANILGKVGKAAQVGAEGAGAGKVLGTAAKFGAEAAGFAAADENAKHIMEQPGQTAESAMSNILFSGLIGAGIGVPFGAAPKAWEVFGETKAGQALKAIRNKVAGVEEAIPSDIGAMIEATGLDVPAEVKASMSESPELQRIFQHLQESQTHSGKAAQKALADFKASASDFIVKTLGKAPSQVDAVANLSENEIGEKVRDTLAKELKQRLDPLTADFDKIKERFAQAPLSEEIKLGIADQVTAFAEKNGIGLLKGDAEKKLISNVLESLPKINTLEEMRLLQSRIQEQAVKMDAWNLGKGMRQIFRTAEESSVLGNLEKEAPDLIPKHQEARAAYSRFMDEAEALNDQLHVGKFRGAQSFVNNVKEMTPEVLLSRIAPKNRADFLELMGRQFPETAELVREHYLNQLVKAGAKRAGKDEFVRPNAVFSVMDSWSPELKRYALGEEGLKKLNAVRGLLSAIPERFNPSGTARTLQSMLKHWPGGAGSVASLLMGHSPISGLVLGELGRIVGTEVPDALKLATLRFAGKDLPISAKGFRASAEMHSNILSGLNNVKKASKAVFKAGLEVLPKSLLPTEKSREKIKEAITEARVNPESLLKVGGDTGHYMPEHAQALSSVAARAVAYLSSLDPTRGKASPLDSDPVPSAVEQSRFDRAIDLVEQPLVVMQHIKDGTVIPEDVQTLKAVYPNLYDHLSHELTAQMAETLTKKDSIPYHTRLGLSLFLGQALDSTMTPAAILSNQPMAQPAAQSPKKSMAALNKLPTNLKSPNQAREQERSMSKA